MNAVEYTGNPCTASSLPFWKTERVKIPEHISIFRDDEFTANQCRGVDEPYFKMVHGLKQIPAFDLPCRFELIHGEVSAFSEHINECYTLEKVSPDELYRYQLHPVFDPTLWIAAAEAESKRVVASGIAELDTEIGEGVLEWIQVSPNYRHMGLGRFIVCELLRRMQNRAKFVTVSGKIKNPSNPFALYKACGFINPVIWHVVADR